MFLRNRHLWILPLAFAFVASCDPNVTIEEEPAKETPPVQVAFDPTLVPGILYRYGQFVAPFADVVQAPDSATLWWGPDSSKLVKLTSNTIWISKSTVFWIQARRSKTWGPKIDVNLAIRNQIDFADDDPQAQYADNAEYTLKLKNIRVLGFGWATTGSALEFSKELATSGLTGLNLKYTLKGKYPSVGVGLKIGGAIDSLGPNRGNWGIDMDSVQTMDFKFDASGLATASTKVILKVGSMDPVYSTACNKGICLQYQLPDGVLASGMTSLQLDQFSYPAWSAPADRPLTARSEILRRGNGILFSVESVSDTVATISGTLKIFSLQFASTPAIAPYGAITAP
ncbi:MAG TPA: hypothetical protein PKO15_08215 [Fibrobacteria bacterium]|nr:hypothetical protein [Fibrobacteria bacterium]HOX51727.1 hypothetical protein [Fibrobacteria bacterium]